MRFSIIATALALVSVGSVLAQDDQPDITAFELADHSDSVATLPGQNLTNTATHSDATNAKSCGSTWYYTRCNYYCPCGWYYYYTGSKKCNGICYDFNNKGCRGTCPKGTHTYCGTCSK
ncbi:hypothetical protein BGW37DRAFT_488955 [Umbelopsis sp. PMI_123]|nr:hypothetical protein BGW37DRAFT_488955 [Umbelopsis sp. PMI_123]